MKVAVIDLFCGMGGFSQGAIEAGAKVVLAVDLWAEALLVHAKNHPDTPIKRMTLGEKYHFSLFKREVDKWRKLGYHVHIHGSPPCQALSNASSRNPEEGMPLVIWFLECVKYADPDSWSMENVVPVRKRLPEGTPSVILNSADFGVAQTRRRCFAGKGWVANPTHSKDEWLGVIDVLPHLSELVRPPSMKNHWSDSRTIETPFPTVTSQSVKQLRLLSERKVGVMANSESYRPNRVLLPLSRGGDQPSYTIKTNPRRLVVNTAGGGASNSKRVNSQDSIIENPSKTIHNNTPSIRTDKPEKIRSLTIQETLILQGFSPDYDLTEANTQKARWTMIGNAVVPAVAKAVIEGII